MVLATDTLNQFDDSRWQAIKRRDRAAAGDFVYGVSTTGVYCRPSCPARLPKVENIRFFSCKEEAERAGFRPCKRCRPNEAPLEQRQADSVAAACKLIEEAEEAPDFDAIAKAAGMSRHHFHRVFKEVMKMTPGAYARALRERRAVENLSSGSNVTEAIYDAGYSSSSRFYENFASKLGMAPSVLAKGGAGEIVHFAIGECSLGPILVAATAKGVCAIEFGDHPEGLLRSFQDRFPNAELRGGDADFERLVTRVVSSVETGGKVDLPLDVRGTAFQHRVWQALTEIPRGKTATYAEVAQSIGQPSAVRAVANACANNRLAVAIPCHRVVRTDGSLSGYRWGVERKAALLEKERSE